jgi:hypothetical protein
LHKNINCGIAATIVAVLKPPTRLIAQQNSRHDFIFLAIAKLVFL